MNAVDTNVLMYTEDFSAYPRIDSLEIVTPFAG